MAITISIDNDRTTIGTQTLIQDETAGVQTPGTTDRGNEIDVTLLAGLLGGFLSPFNTFLNGTIFGSHVLTAAQKLFASVIDGASSSTDFVKVTTTNNETISNLFFSDVAGNALDGDQVAGMTTLDGQNVYLYSNGDFCIATTSATAGMGRVVAAFYLNEDTTDHKSAQVQMVTFEPLNHPDGTNPDDALNFTDVLQVSASGSLSFNFDNLESGSFLWAAVGSGSAGLLVTGQDLNVIDTASKLGDIVKGGGDPSDSVNTSQGGIGATIGVNSQHFADQSGSGGTKIDGPTGVFTLVSGFVPLNNVAQATGINVNQIDYSSYINAPSAKIFISQTTGSSAIGGAMRITLWEAGGSTLANPTGDHAAASLLPEEGYSGGNSYIGDQDTDSHLHDDFAVNVANVTVKRGNTTYTWTSANSGVAQGGITVTISANAIILSGIQTSDTIGFAAVDDPNSLLDGTFNRFDIQCLAGSNAFDIGRIDLDQGVSVHQALGDQLVVEDDGPSISATLTGAPTPTVDESDFSIDGTGSFAAQFTPVYGTDGAAAASPVTYALSTPGGASGLVDTASGQSIVLSLVGGVIQGRTVTSDVLCFTVSVDSSGVVTLNEIRAVVHADGTDPDDSRTLASAGLVVLTGTAHDKDGDSASTPLNIGTQLIFKDDGPSITGTITGAPTPTVDESDFATNGTGSFAAQFSPVYGADGQAATPVTYALSTLGGASGLVDTATGQSIVLSLVGGVVQGRTVTSDVLCFTVSVDSSGVVTLDEIRAVVHADATNPDDSRSLSSASLVVLTATVHDKDGDTASKDLGIGTQLIFKDDGPSITGTITGAPTPTVDESNFATDGTGNFAPQFSPVYGADGQAATPVTYGLSTPGGASGLVDTATGQSIVLSLVGGVVQGRTVTSDVLCFTVSVDSSGVVTLDEIRAVVHADATNPDDSRSLSSASLVVLTATAQDKDGDTASKALGIGTQLIFKDDGPSITGSIVGATSPTTDESIFATDGTGNFAPQFTPVYGADGAGSTPVTYGLSTPGGASGLIDTITGQSIVLSLVGGVIQGRTVTSNVLCFTVSVDSSGVVTLDGLRAVVHSPDSGADQSATLSSAGAVVLTATAYDKDGDSASAQLNIGQLLVFKDDAPTITAQILDGAVAFAVGATGIISHSLNGAVGADLTSATQQSSSGLKQYTITSWTEPQNVYPGLDGVLSADKTKVTYYSTSVTADQNPTTAVYELSLNQTDNAGAGSYTFTVLKPPPIIQNNFDFTDLPSGQNFMGVIATDKADLSKGGLLVMPTNPDLNADGSMTNVSGTVNTSKGGGPVTIGNENQAFDSTDEGAFFCYVDNPLATAVGGLQLNQVSADNANTIDFDGTNEATRASVEIVQASGSGTAKRPGPALQITAYDINPQTVGHLGDAGVETDSRAFALDPTATASESKVVSVKIFDASGTVVEFRTNLDAGVSNFGSLTGGSSDSAVGITFVLDNANGAGTADDDYSVLVSNLKANYTIEFVTAEAHDLAQVQHVSGSYDIGGFNVFNNVNIPAQDFDFSVQISDYDNDLYGGPAVTFANFGVTIDPLAF